MPFQKCPIFVLEGNRFVMLSCSDTYWVTASRGDSETENAYSIDADCRRTEVIRGRSEIPVEILSDVRIGETGHPVLG